jgi:hypothetical protein
MLNRSTMTRRGGKQLMAKSVSFSFYYDRDAWRVNQVSNMGAVEGKPILNAQEWEQVRQRGDQAIINWIAEKMQNKSAVVVLAGRETADRPWVQYEIRYAWDNYKPLVGIRIHGLTNQDGKTDSPGGNPFQTVTLTGGGTLAPHLSLHTPSGSTSQQVYADINANITKWMNGARGRSRG